MYLKIESFANNIKFNHNHRYYYPPAIPLPWRPFTLRELANVIYGKYESGVESDGKWPQEWDQMERTKLYYEDRIKQKINDAWYEGVVDRLDREDNQIWTKYRKYLRIKYKSIEINTIRAEYNDTSQANRRHDAQHCLNFAKIVKKHFEPFENLMNNIKFNPFTADYKAPNPYFVQVSSITINHELLKNFLHIRVFMNRSVSDEKRKLHTKHEKADYAKGRIKALIIIVKDQVIDIYIFL
jgi:hypothetical protein